MVAKGLNFPGVKLVGIVLADTGLHMPDFRAAERTFSLIVQVSGRAGRFAPDGKVIVQTYMPKNGAIQLAARIAMEEFYAQELEMRKALRFPPFSRLFRMVFRGRSETAVRESAENMAHDLEKALEGKAEVLGPSECPLGVIAGNHRYQILLRTDAFVPVHTVLKEHVSRLKLRRGIFLEVDVDPVSLL